jgi:hypothetical protein
LCSRSASGGRGEAACALPHRRVNDGSEYCGGPASRLKRLGDGRGLDDAAQFEDAGAKSGRRMTGLIATLAQARRLA